MIGVGESSESAAMAAKQPPSAHGTFEGHMSEERRRVSGFDANLDAMRDAIRRMRELSETMVHRWQLRDRRALNDRIITVDREIDRITSGFYVAKLDERVNAHRASQVRQARQERHERQARQDRQDRQTLQARQASGTEDQAGLASDIHPASHASNASNASNASTAPTRKQDMQDEPVEVCTEMDDLATDAYIYHPMATDREEDTCALCDGSMRLVVAKALMCCCVCGYSIAYLDSTVSALAYGDDANLSVTFSYKRINHFSEWIARIQAKTTHDVPQATVNTIMGELAASNVKASDVTQSCVRDAMKRLKCKSKLTEYIPHITMRITGNHPPRLTDEMEQLLKLCFIALQVGARTEYRVTRGASQRAHAPAAINGPRRRSRHTPRPTERIS